LVVWQVKLARHYNDGRTIVEQTLQKYANSQANLENRPDYDGKLTLSEANSWYRNGEGGALFVDAAKIDLSPVKVSDFKEEGGVGIYKNYFLTTNQETGRIYGTIKLTLENSETGSVKLGGKNRFLDEYNFEQKPRDGTIKRDVRNIGTAIGSAFAGGGNVYKIYTPLFEMFRKDMSKLDKLGFSILYIKFQV
jgi:hypothetical protein